MERLHDIMDREMTRKEFLTTLGFGLASILGFSSVIRFLFGKGHASQNQGRIPSGYGASVYGGNKRQG